MADNDNCKYDYFADTTGISPEERASKNPDTIQRVLNLKALLPIQWAQGRRHKHDEDDDDDLPEISWHAQLGDSAAAFLASQALNMLELHHDEQVS